MSRANYEEMMVLLFHLKNKCKTEKQKMLLAEIISRVECYETIKQSVELYSYPMELPKEDK